MYRWDFQMGELKQCLRGLAQSPEPEINGFDQSFEPPVYWQKTRCMEKTVDQEMVRYPTLRWRWQQQIGPPKERLTTRHCDNLRLKYLWNTIMNYFKARKNCIIINKRFTTLFLDWFNNLTYQYKTAEYCLYLLTCFIYFSPYQCWGTKISCTISIVKVCV